MTRPALGPTPPLTPCMRNPELWDSSDSTAAIAACRQQCPRRFACAQEALDGPKHLVSSLNGVIAGVAIPEQNEYGTSKAHKAALKRLETIAALGAAARAAGQRCPTTQQTCTPVDQSDPRTSAARQPQTSDEAHELASTNQPANTDVIMMPREGFVVTDPPCRSFTRIPKGQVDIHGAARMTGLAPQTLRNLRMTGDGPKSWLIPGGRRGRIRYWIADVETWMAERQQRRTTTVARAS